MVKINKPTILNSSHKKSKDILQKEDVNESLLDTKPRPNLQYKLVNRTSLIDKCLFKCYVWLTDYFNLFIVFLLVAIFFTINNYYLCALNDNQNQSTLKLDQQLKLTTKNTYYSADKCTVLKEENRLECLQQNKILSKEQCLSIGCCWLISKTKSPNCFYPVDYKTYYISNLSSTDMGLSASIQLFAGFNSTFPGDVSNLTVDINFRTEDVLQIKIYDPNVTRYEPPFPRIPQSSSKAAHKPKYSVKILQSGKFGFKVIRTMNNKTIFDTLNSEGFIFSNYFLQLSALLPTKTIYGLGQQRNDFLLDTRWNKVTLFNHDAQPKDGVNQYGSHPFYLAVEEDGFAYGVLLLNSNAMDIILSPAPAITYRPIGGVFDFYFFMGPSPAEVLRQYTALVGRPDLPPYWSLGFHLCRFGYKTLKETVKVWNRTRAAGIPFDTQWNDLDYMDHGNDFTYSQEHFADLPQFVDKLHEVGMHYVVLVDPGISASELPGTYPPYDEGVAQRVFITDYSGYKPFIGKVWNKKTTVWIDFLKPASVKYWMDQLRTLHQKFAFDGAWIDMNDPSNFLNGTVSGCPPTLVDYPPYTPGVAGGVMFYRTVCMSAKHGDDVDHYNVHNIYGLAEAIVTNFAMLQIRGKRGFVISRSSFPGLGRYAGVWTGDISSTWDDMSHSISDILSFSLFGIPMSGADICGFSGNATAELCLRWSQLGAFYPFSRNHNSDLSSDQDPVALGQDVVAAARNALLTRYSLLPYLYTLFWRAHSDGDTVARPMFVEFPKDSNTFSLHSQFLWGSALLIAPVLKQGAVTKNVYLPDGRWYDFYSYELIRGENKEKELPAPLEKIPLLIRGGYILPMQKPGVTTTESRLNPIELLIALNDDRKATGELYWDDGDSMGYLDDIFNFIQFSVINNTLSSKVIQWSFNETSLQLHQITILGVDVPPHRVVVNQPIPFSYDEDRKVLRVENLELNLAQTWSMNWN